MAEESNLKPQEESKFIPRYVGIRTCGDQSLMGVKSFRYDYILKATTGDEEYPYVPRNYVGVCTPFVHATAQIDHIQVNYTITGSPTCTLGDVDCGDIDSEDISVTGNITSSGQITSNASGTEGSGPHILSNKKDHPFDMPHPNKKGWRLRHVCIEGPEIAVYCRGKVPIDGIIDLPSFWDGLVNPEDMTISLTPIGCWQELFVKEVLSGKQVVVINNTEGLINADYHIIARRLDDDLIVEYEGESHEDYPGGNEGYSFNFEHNYVKNLIQNTVRNHLDKTPQMPYNT